MLISRLMLVCRNCVRAFGFCLIIFLWTVISVSCMGFYGSSTSSEVSSTSSLPDCGSGHLFTALPLSPSDFTDLTPLGNLNPTGHTFPTMHHYFYIVNSDGEGAPDVVNVHMPGDAWIVNINTSEHLSEEPVYTDYSISFKPCSQYRAYFGHIQSLSTDLQSQLEQKSSGSCNTYTTGGKDYRYCTYSMEHYVPADTVIGTAGGTAGQWALDFGARDKRIPALQWANQTRWENGAGDAIYTACVSNAYEPTLKTELESRFGYSGNYRSEPPVCGTIEQDLAGTAQGVWFLASADSNRVFPEDPHVALVHDKIDPSVGVLSIGTSLPEASGAHSFTPASSGLVNREFSEISGNDAGIYCYALTGNSAVLLQLVDDTSLKLEFKEIDCDVDTPFSFTGSAVLFVR